MKNYHDFTTDPSRFSPSEMGAFLDALHAADQHYVSRARFHSHGDRSAVLRAWGGERVYERE